MKIKRNRKTNIYIKCRNTNTNLWICAHILWVSYGENKINRSRHWRHSNCLRKLVKNKNEVNSLNCFMMTHSVIKRMIKIHKYFMLSLNKFQSHLEWIEVLNTLRNLIEWTAFQVLTYHPHLKTENCCCKHIVVTVIKVQKYPDVNHFAKV